MNTPTLELRGIDAAIEGVAVLRGVDVTLHASDSVALIGRNGAGKTTLLRTIMGFVALEAGAVFVAGERIDALPAHQRPGLGIGYAPEDRRLFSAFSVEENLLLPAEVARLAAPLRAQRLERVYSVLPELTELRQRPAGSVSGGQGKMVALGRALMIGERLILLDEPFQGLAPALARRYADALHRLREADRELTVLITESNPSLLHDFAQRTLTIERGELTEGVLG